MPSFVRVGISGLGLIGGSIALALRRKEPRLDLWGFDPDPDARELALASGAFREVSDGLRKIAPQVELMVLAGPVSGILEDMSILSGIQGLRLVVTDVGSTKTRIMLRAATLPPGVAFVGGHPLAGGEQRGFQAADALLFENTLWLLTPPSPKADGAAERTVKELVALAGAQGVTIDAAAHDRVLACTSHLPQLIAVALANTVADLEIEYPEAPSLVGGGFRDLTRIAGSPFGMWESILATNKEAIRLSLETLVRHLEAAMSPGLGDSAFQRAAHLRNAIAPGAKGLLSPGFSIAVLMADEPGALAGVSRALADARLNIKDIELLKVKEGEWGTFRLSFGSQEDRRHALDVLARAGYQARERG